MRTDSYSKAGDLPGIIIAASDYDRLVELADAARHEVPQVASYLERELVRASVVADSAFDRSVARLGSCVTYSDDQSGRERAVTLAWPREADVEHGRISVLTSIGAALLGMRAGQSIDWPVPGGGSRTLTVIAVHNDDESRVPSDGAARG
jgi:regulator of nucleoside diphosphate kinase